MRLQTIDDSDNNTHWHSSLHWHHVKTCHFTCSTSYELFCMQFLLLQLIIYCKGSLYAYLGEFCNFKAFFGQSLNTITCASDSSCPWMSTERVGYYRFDCNMKALNPVRIEPTRVLVKTSENLSVFGPIFWGPCINIYKKN